MARWVAGCPEPDQLYPPGPVPGYRIVLGAGGQDYVANTGGGQVVLCDPIFLSPIRRATCP